MHKRPYLVSDDWDLFPLGVVHLFETKKNKLEAANQERIAQWGDLFFQLR